MKMIVYRVMVKELIREIYARHKQNSNIIFKKNPHYKVEDLEYWAWRHDIFKFLKIWIDSEGDSEFKPTIRRINTDKGYGFQNIIMTNPNCIKTSSQGKSKAADSI